VLVAGLFGLDGVPGDALDFERSGAPSKSVRVTPAGVRMATSPSLRKWMLRVWWRMPGTSEARKYSPSPMPMTAGGPKRAATSLSGSSGGEDADGEGSGEALDGAADGFFEGDWGG
jgi:hypothetical protein